MEDLTDEPKWKQFERLIAGLHHSLSPGGATVKWDDHIDGRQFDVTIRFTQLAYDFLTVIECKDSIVPVGDVDAFVTKSRSARANKAVIVSSKGFQSGAIKVASEHAIDLYVFQESDEWPASLRVISERPALSIVNVEIMNGAECRHRFSNSPSALTYYARHTVVRGNNTVQSLHELIDAARQAWELGVDDTEQDRSIPLSARSIVEVPFVDAMPASHVKFTVQQVSAKVLETGGMDPTFVAQLFRFTNAITGEERTIDAAELWIGFDTQVREGYFYYNPFLAIVYFCEKITESLAHYVLIESYQHGNLFQARFTQDVLYARHLLEVTDPSELIRLRRMLARYQQTSEVNLEKLVPVVGRNEPCPCGSGAKYKKCHGK